MNRNDHSPIITSLLDTDAYKLHMQQAVFYLYPETVVEAEFFCRGNDNLGEFSEKIREQILLLSQISLTFEELQYLSHLAIFKTEYLDWLSKYRFNPDNVIVSNKSGKLSIKLVGKWCDIILWEVPLLAIISEVVHQARNKIDETRLLDIIDEHFETMISPLKLLHIEIDLTNFKLADFGTRRRYSFQVQSRILTLLKDTFQNNKFGVLFGTSNYHFARIFDLSAIGTQAHEWFQAHQQLTPYLANSQKLALAQWLKIYPESLGIALTDCINMQSFLLDFDKNFAHRFTGLRHDSGDPFLWAENALDHYKKLGINPSTKYLVFSDSLTIEKAVRIFQHFNHKAQLLFGIGTYLTCNLPYVSPINMVIKLTKCNDRPVAKLSDSPGKTLCQDINFIHSLKKAFAIPD